MFATLTPPVVPALLCSSTSMLLTEPLIRPLRSSLRAWRRARPWPRPRPPGVTALETGRLDGPDDRRPVMAVLAPGRPPERVVAEAVALAARRSSQLQFIVLRRTVGFSTDAALVAAAERASATAQMELLTRAANAIPFLGPGEEHAGPECRGTIHADVVRVAGTDFDAPCTWVTRRVLAVARRRGAGVVVIPAVLLGAEAAPRHLVVLPVEDFGWDGVRGGVRDGAAADLGQGGPVRPHTVPGPAVDPPSTGRTLPAAPPPLRRT